MSRRSKAPLQVRIAGAILFLILALSFGYIAHLPNDGPIEWVLACVFYFIAACFAGLTVQALFDL